MTTGRNEDRDRSGLEQAGEAMGEMAGRMMGRATETAINLTGEAFSSMASMLGSWWSSDQPQRAAASFSSEQDQTCRNHFQARSSGRDYATSRPLYQFGHVAGQNPDYQNRSFSEVEPDLRRAWESGPSSQHGQWEDVRDYIGFGFSTRGGDVSGGAQVGGTGGI